MFKGGLGSLNMGISSKSVLSSGSAYNFIPLNFYSNGPPKFAQGSSNGIGISLNGMAIQNAERMIHLLVIVSTG